MFGEMVGESPEDAEEEEEIDYMALSFQKRWELIGVSKLPPPEPWEPAPPFNAVKASQRLTSDERVFREEFPRKHVPWEVRRRRIETGSALKYQHSQPPGRVGVGDRIAYVHTGVAVMQGSTGPDAMVHHRRVQRHGEEAPGAESKKQRSKPRALSNLGEEARSKGAVMVLDEAARQDLASRSRANAPARRHLFSEFGAFCLERYGSVGGLCSTIALQPLGTPMDQPTWVSYLLAAGYKGSLSAKSLFVHFDADGDGLVSRADVVGAMSRFDDEPVPNRWEALQRDIDRKLFTSDFDCVEAHAISSVADLGAGGAAGAFKLKQHISSLLAKVGEDEPLLEDLMRFFYASFKSLKSAFRQLDANQHGVLSKDEFSEALRVLTTSSGTYIDAHLRGLASRLTAELQVLTPATLAKVDECRDPILRRLASFLAKVNEEGLCPAEGSVTSDAWTRAATGRSSRVSEQDLIETLRKWRYPDWLFDELFVRIDTDGSGRITLSEFTRFLEHDLPKKRPATFARPAPWGDAKRVAQVSGAHSMINESMRLKSLGKRKAPRRVPDDPSMSTPWVSEAGLGYAMVYERPDHLAKVEDKVNKARMKRSRSCPFSEFLVHGEHRFSTSSAALMDLTEPTWALTSRKFDQRPGQG